MSAENKISVIIEWNISEENADTTEERSDTFESRRENGRSRGTEK